MPEVADAFAAQAMEDARRMQAGIGVQMEEPPTQAVETGVRECSQDMLLEMLTRKRKQWRLKYPKGGVTDYGDAQLTLRYVVNDKGRVGLDGIEVLEQESMLEKPGYLGMFSQQAVATVRSWRFPLDNSEGRVCAPRASGYQIQFSFRF